jgi:hypothetical protein
MTLAPGPIWQDGLGKETPMSIIARHPAPHDIPEGRQFAWLVPYLQKAEIDAVLSQNPFRVVDHRPLDQVVQDARQAASGLRPYVMQPVQALSASCSRRPTAFGLATYFGGNTTRSSTPSSAWWLSIP